MRWGTSLFLRKNRLFFCVKFEVLTNQWIKAFTNLSGKTLSHWSVADSSWTCVHKTQTLFLCCWWFCVCTQQQPLHCWQQQSAWLCLAQCPAPAQGCSSTCCPGDLLSNLISWTKNCYTELRWCVRTASYYTSPPATTQQPSLTSISSFTVPG